MVIRVPDQRPTKGGYTALDDRMLVLDFQAGNPQAYVEIHRRYGALARHVCQRFLPNRQDADEAFQESMIRVFQGLYRFNGSYALAPWIARIAKNVSLDHVRGTSRRPQADGAAPAADELARPGDEADDIVERLVQRDLVLAVLADMPETHRRVLMLREIDGLSHREVAQELDVSTPQAKALIHRAKGSFRRRWLEKLADRGGLAALAFLPLVWLAKFENMFRRVGERAGAAAQTAQAAAPDALVQTVTSTAAPAASGIGERLVAAGVTILVAGSVTVGAAKIVNERAVPAPEVVAAAAAAIVPETAPSGLEVPEVTDPEVPLERSKADPTPEVEPDPVVTTDPVVVDPAPTEQVSPSPGTETPPADPSPQPEPSPEPPPPPPEPPAYDFGFSAPKLSTLCPCTMLGSRVATSISAIDGGVSVRETIDGRAIAGGQDAYGLRLEYDATAMNGSGSLTTSFYIDTPEGGWYAYRGSASLASATATEHGTDYELVGAFQLQNAGAATDGVLQSGNIRVVLRVWTDSEQPVLYGANFVLSA